LGLGINNGGSSGNEPVDGLVAVGSYYFNNNSFTPTAAGVRTFFYQYPSAGRRRQGRHQGQGRGAGGGDYRGGRFGRALGNGSLGIGSAAAC
jgi:hypothetical protein